MHIKSIIQNLNLVLLDFGHIKYLELEESNFKNEITSIIDNLIGLLESEQEVQLILFDADEYYEEEPPSLKHTSFVHWFEQKLFNSGYNYKIAFPNPFRNLRPISLSQLSIPNFQLR